MAIGDNIRRLRVKNHLSQEELAALIGVTNQAISSWEKGKTNPKMGNVQRMAELFFVPKSAIIEDAPQYEQGGPPKPIRFLTGLSNGRFVYSNEIAAYMPPNTMIDFAVKVAEDMYALESFCPGDVAFAHETKMARDNDIVVIEFEGKVLVRRYVDRDGFSIFLSRASGDGSVIDIKKEPNRILGVVVSFYRNLREG